MSVHHHTWGRASALPLDLIAQAIPKLSWNDLAALTERLIDRLDEVSGDTDLEFNGDEKDGSLGDDDFFISSRTDYAAGCPVSDPTEDSE